VVVLGAFQAGVHQLLFFQKRVDRFVISGISFGRSVSIPSAHNPNYK
jgi:hypothetical protein